MKNIKVKSYIVLFLSVVFISVSALMPNTSKANEIQKTKTTTISLPSLQCSICVVTITKALNKHDGILKVKINKAKKTAKITYDSDKISVAEIENAITAAGYDANEKPADPAAYEKLHGCCKKL